MGTRILTAIGMQRMRRRGKIIPRPEVQAIVLAKGQVLTAILPNSTLSHRAFLRYVQAFFYPFLPNSPLAVVPALDSSADDRCMPLDSEL